MQKKSLDKFNRTIAIMDKAARGEIGENYLTDIFTAFVVKRTAKTWIVSRLNYEVL